MKIAVLGWGLLTWESEKNLEREFNVKGEWNSDGPELPIEYLRHSLDGRIMLVINPGSKIVQTLWIESGLEYMNKAISNLRKREGTIEQNIGFLDLTNNSRRTKFSSIISIIKDWALTKGLDGVIWTEFSANIKGKDRSFEGIKNLIQQSSQKERESLKTYIMNNSNTYKNGEKHNLKHVSVIAGSAENIIRNHINQRL